ASTRIVSLFPLAVLCLLPQRGAAGVIITPESIPSLPPLTLPAAHGVAVPDGGWVDNQYGGLGLAFFGAAITQLGGRNVWTPAGDFTGSGVATLNYAPGASLFVSFVDPLTQNAASTNSISVEFTGVPTGRALMTIFDGSASNPVFIDAGVGPHGGGLISFDEP